MDDRLRRRRDALRFCLLLSGYIQRRYLEFAAREIPGAAPDAASFGSCWVLLITDDFDKVLGIVVYNNYTKHDVHLTVTAVCPGWINRTGLAVISHIAFDRLGVRRISAYCSSKNSKILKFVRQVGFEKEGVLREFQYPDDTIIFGLLKDDCKWKDLDRVNSIDINVFSQTTGQLRPNNTHKVV